MSKQRYTCPFWLPTLFLLALIPLFVGCSAIGPGNSNATVPVEPSKGPGAANLTATALASPVSNTCPTLSTPPAPAQGWKIYKDSHFSLQFAIPPGWRAGSFTDASGNDYIVQIFPPASTTPIGQMGFADQEHFAITITLSGPTSTYANDPNWRADAITITISGTRTPIYDRTTPDCEELNRGATGNFGQHHFTFFMTSVPGRAKNDIALFLGVLQSFVYSG